MCLGAYYMAYGRYSGCTGTFLETQSGTILRVWQGDSLLPELLPPPSHLSSSLCSVSGLCRGLWCNAIAGCLDLFYVSLYFPRKGMDFSRWSGSLI